MFAQFKNLQQLFEFFKDQKTCLEYWEKERWQGNPTCPHCGGGNPYKTNRGYKCTEITCQKKFTALVDSIFESTKLPLQKWFAAIYLATSHRKGIPALQLSRLLSISPNHAWHMLHRIRETFTEVAPDILEGIVEADEALVGGKNMNRRRDKKFVNSQGRSCVDKMGVVGVLQREGSVRTFVADNLDGETVQTIVRENVAPGSILVTDDYNGYKALGCEYHHVILKHKGGGFVKVVEGYALHTQNMEGYWTLLKKAYSHYHYMSPKHLQRYCNESTFRYDRRKMSDREKFDEAIKRCGGRTLKYAKLIADVPGRPRFLQANKVLSS